MAWQGDFGIDGSVGRLGAFEFNSTGFLGAATVMGRFEFLENGEANMTDESYLPQRKVNSWLPYLLGLPLAGLCWVLVMETPLAQTEVKRYFSHPVEAVEIVMFCVAMGAFLAKLIGLRREKASLEAGLLTSWNGTPVEVEEAPRLLGVLLTKAPRQKNTWLGQRLGSALDYLTQRKSTDGFDDQLRSLSDIDAFSLDGSYGLTRFITWAVPILGFLGTVLGITGAIAGVTPEVLEKSMSSVTDGLALAFDTTALALGLTMVTMFLSLLLEKAEQGHMELVDRFVEKNLSNRFLRKGQLGPQALPFDPVPIQNALANAGMGLIQLSENSAQELRGQFEQMLGELRTQSTHSMGQWMNAWQEQMGNRLGALETAQSQRLQVAEEAASVRSNLFVGHMEQLSQSILGQIREIQSMGQSAQSLLNTQQILQQNLASLAGLGAFDQAMHSLIGAIHLLTSRAGQIGAGQMMGQMGADWHGSHESNRGPAVSRLSGQQVA